MGEKIRRENRKFKFETLQLHVGQENPDPATDARAVPIYQSSSFVFRNCDHAAARFDLSDAGNIYGRLTNPTQDVFEKRMAALEGGAAALAVASGAAAISYSIQNVAQNGGHIVAAKNIYGGTFNLLLHTLPQYGITTTFVDIFNDGELEAAIQDNTKAVFIETLGNPNSDVVDIEAVAEIAHKHKIPLIVDNTFATPYLVRPIEYGADIVVHSAKEIPQLQEIAGKVWKKEDELKQLKSELAALDRKIQLELAPAQENTEENRQGNEKKQTEQQPESPHVDFVRSHLIIGRPGLSESKGVKL